MNARRGVALIIAISVLAALLFLALPFVFSQSASVAGARASAWDASARRGSERSAGLATALAVYATGLHRSPQLATQLNLSGQANPQYVQLGVQIGDTGGLIQYPAYGETAWRMVIDSTQPWNPTNATPPMLPELDEDPAHGAGSGVAKPVIHGAIIEDESRRLDPNCLGERAWAIVLSRANIADPYTVSWDWSMGDVSKPLGDPLHWGNWNQTLKYGRLARRLTYWRPITSHRFIRIEDLLGADPNAPAIDPPAPYTLGCVPITPQGYDRRTGAATWPHDLGTAWGDGSSNDARQRIELTRNAYELRGYRVAAMTQSELDLLRPYLSFHNPAQGRSGIIDLGTVVAEAPRSNGWYGVTTDELSPSTMGVGREIRPHDSSRVRAQDPSRGGEFNNYSVDVGDAVAIEALPSLNINTIQSNSIILQLFGDMTAGTLTDWPPNPLDTPVTSVGGIGRLNWLDPRAGGNDPNPANWYERPPVGLSGFGIVAIEGAATARDREGSVVAQRRRRTVAQAVPQERPFEAAWRTQGELEALIRARHGSWIMAGPHPTNRIKDWGAVRRDMEALDCAGWIEPAPVCSFGRSAACVFDWRVPFGLGNPVPWSEVLNDVVTGTMPAFQPAQVWSNTRAVGALTSQGLKLKAGIDTLAYTIEASTGPMRFNVAIIAPLSSTSPGVPDQMGTRHVSMRFSMPQAPLTGKVVLLEARAQEPGLDGTHVAIGPDGLAQSGFGTPETHIDDQSVWRVHYDVDDKMLVMVIANAALPWDANSRIRYGCATWRTSTDAPTDGYDKRCDGGTSLPLEFAPAWKAQRVEFRYKVPDGLKSGQWYHLQAYCASDRPGLHGLILDGIVGRDATQAGTGMMTRLGDHYTWPSMRLSTPLSGVYAPTTNAHLSTPSTIALRIPPNPDGSPATVTDVLPSHGLIRIDDEFFSYDSVDAIGTTLLGVQRARRTNTDQSNTRPVTTMVNGQPVTTNQPTESCLPVTQAHAEGALVTPGWSQMDIVSGNWLRGGATLVAPAMDQTAGLTSTPQQAKVIGLVLDNSNNPVFTQPSSVTIDPIPSEVGGITWPLTAWAEHGYVEFWVMDGSTTIPAKTGRAYFTRSDATLTLTWAMPPAACLPSGPPAGYNNLVFGGAWNPEGSETVFVRQVSIAVRGAVLDPTDSKKFADSGLIQLLDTGVGASTTPGRCEWVRYDFRIDLSPVDGELNHRYFVRRGGFGRDWTQDPNPTQDTRGAQRTAWDRNATWNWPQGTLVLPVMAISPGWGRLESGDVVTIVPRLIVSGGVRKPPFQAVIRHNARDGYPVNLSASGAKWHAGNEYFAFAHQLPDPVVLPDPDPAVSPNGLTILIGRGWNGDDLSMALNTPTRRGTMPQRTAMTDTAHARLFIGAPAPQNSWCQATDIIIDDLCASPLSGGADANVQPGGPATSGGCEIVSFNNQNNAGIDATRDALPVTVKATMPVFSGSAYGLCQIDGEVFAYRRSNDDYQAVLIARALLGSEAVAHALPADAPMVSTVLGAAPTRTVAPTLPVVRLPMGPVGELSSPLAPGDQGTALDVVEIPYSSYYRDPPASGFTTAFQPTYADTGSQHIVGSPFVLIHDASPSVLDPEILRLLPYPTQANQRTTARWLRGLYGTTAQAWTPQYTWNEVSNVPLPPGGRPVVWVDQDPPHPPNPILVPIAGPQNPGKLNPVVISWWPRFAPGLPATWGSGDAAAILRSRSFAWAGFPLRLSGSRFDPTIPALAPGVADVPFFSGYDGAYEVRALAAGPATPPAIGLLFDWDSADGHMAAAGLNLTSLFNWDRFIGREVDGAEMRVHWKPSISTATTSLAKASDLQGRTPRLGADDSQAVLAPVTGAGIRLRCMAPTRVLAVEEVR